MNRNISKLYATSSLKRVIMLAGGAVLLHTVPAGAQTVQPEVVFLPAPDVSNTPAQCRNQAGASATDTYTSAISADGTIVAGGATNAFCHVLWRNGVPEIQPGNDPLVPALGNGFGVVDISGDGRTLVGYDNEILSFGNARYWTQASDTQLFPILETLSAAEYNALPGRSGAIRSVIRRPFNESFVNNDGQYFAVNMAFESDFGPLGNSDRRIIPDGRVYRWNPTNGYLELPQLGGSLLMSASGISGDGRRIIGNAADLSGIPFGRDVAWQWIEGVGTAALPGLSLNPRNDAATGGQPLAASSQAWGISSDGSTVVGTSRDDNGYFQAVYWRNGIATGLGFLSGRTPVGITLTDDNATVAVATNLDGSVIVGTNGIIDTAWRWTAVTGIQDLNIFAQNAGLNLNGFRLFVANGVSDNGQNIVGNAYNLATGEGRGYLLTIAQITRTQLIVRLTLPGVTLQSIVNQSFNTQVDGTLNGQIVFTRSFTDTITSSTGVNALVDARTALQQVTGLRRVVIGAPTLVSNTTTVLSTVNNTVDVPSGSSLSTATINSFGPATIVTGDLGICATGVVGSTAPTGCSLPGTIVNVDPGVLNSNIYTTTTNSFTPTTTPTVNQLISSRWQVAATAGNRFGTAHALVGPAAFDRGDRLLMQMLGQGRENADTPAVARALVPMKNGLALGNSDSGLSMFGGYFNGRANIDGSNVLAIGSARGEADGFVLGVEKSLGDFGHVGIAADHGKSDYLVRDPSYPEQLGLKQTQIGFYGGWNQGRLTLTGAASYGFGNVRTTIASPAGASVARRNLNMWSAGAQIGYDLPIAENAGFELVSGLRHNSVKQKRFTEVGGSTPLLGVQRTTERTRFYVGGAIDGELALGRISLNSRFYARYAHDMGEVSGLAEVNFVSTPNAPSLQAIGAPVGRNVAEAGAALEAQLGSKFAFWVGYDGSFRNGAQSHTGVAGFRLGF